MARLNDKWAITAHNTKHSLGQATVGPFDSYEQAWQWGRAQWPEGGVVEWRVIAIIDPKAYG